MERITIAPTFPAWQRAARIALRRELPPEDIAWEELLREQPALDLFEENDSGGAQQNSKVFRVQKDFIQVARLVALHADERRWALLYRLVWRLTHDDPKLLEIVIDSDVARALAWAKSVRHDIHKMRAFVRFREVELENESWFVAWFEPEHHIIEHNAQFFADRFASMHWSILTPDLCAHWDGKEITITAGVDKSQTPRAQDEMEKLWLTYYSNIFNPARIKVHAMEAEMPKKYWRNLREATLIPVLLKEAPKRVETMRKESAAKNLAENEMFARPATVPETSSLKEVAEAAKICTACHLYKRATQTVFGEGRKNVALMLLGEQPGDQEDLAGIPFVGPAGKILDRALIDAGIDREEVYVTNTVKHFKWEPRGKRRIHQKPNSREITACRPWLEAELRLVRPKLLVCLGSTAAQAIFGSNFRVTKERGKLFESQLASKVVTTVHPSSLLRQPDEESREREYALFVADLRAALKASAGE